MNNIIPFKQIHPNSEKLDINELLTNGQKGIIAYRVTGISKVDFIKSNYLVFVNPFTIPQTGNLVLSKVSKKNCVNYFKEDVLIDFLGVIIGHLAVYTEGLTNGK